MTRLLPLASSLPLSLLALGLPASMASTASSRAVPRPIAETPLAGQVSRPVATPPDVTAFVNVTVVPMDTERVLEGQTVVVEQGRIAALGPSGQVRVPSGAVRVEGRGKVLIPGLADCHAHLSEYRLLREIGGPTPLSRNERMLFLWLAQGLTTARILDHGSGGSSAAYGPATSRKDVLQLRARALAGEILSPRIYTAGSITEGIARPDSPKKLELDQVAEAVRTYKALGYDFIKVHPGYIPEAVFDSLAATARRAGLPLVGHTVVPLARALETYRSIEHLTGYAGRQGYAAELPKERSGDALTARIQELAVATQRAGVWNCPTLYNAIRNHVNPSELALQQRVIKALQEAGAGLLSGSDRLQSDRPNSELVKLTPAQRRLEAVYGYAGATHQELQALVGAGLTPYQALATSTRNVAAYFGTLDSTGTITVGKRADLVLLEGNPLADIRQTERIAGVMLGGRWLDRAELDRRTAEISAWLEKRCAAPAAGQTPCPAKISSP